MKGKAEARLRFKRDQGRWYRFWWESGSTKVHSQCNSRWEREHGLIPDGHVIHHIDQDKTNDALDNLRLMTAEEHDCYSGECRRNHKTVDGVQHRWCPGCKKYGRLDCFYVRKGGGFCALCRDCHKKYCRAYYAEHAEDIKARKREYWARNKDRINARKRAWRAEGRVAI